jgi:hypothetical protein
LILSLRRKAFRKGKTYFNYSFFFLLTKEAASMNPPKMSMNIPDRRLIFAFSEMEYISLPLVVNPNMVRIKPKIPNISPIGNLISSPMVAFFIGYQNMILKITAMMPTIHARAFGR